MYPSLFLSKFRNISWISSKDKFGDDGLFSVLRVGKSAGIMKTSVINMLEHRIIEEKWYLIQHKRQQSRWT